MTSFKLYYFDLRGRGEVVRLVLAAAGVKFEDHRIEFSEWPELKKKAPFGQLPYIEIQDGDKKLILSQSTSIARYLAREFGLAGNGKEEQATVEMFGDQITDLQNEMLKIVIEKDDQRKQEMKKQLQTKIIPKNFAFFEKKIASSNSGFLAPSGLTWADLHLFNVIENLRDKKDFVLENFPHLKMLDRKIRSHDKLAEYISNRPVTFDNPPIKQKIISKI